MKGKHILYYIIYAKLYYIFEIESVCTN